MLPWILLDTAPIPGDTGELRLYQRGSEYSIRLGHYELMNSRVHASEDALAHLACARLAGRARPRILIGGLGIGFTLAAVLQSTGPDAEVVISELVPAVVAWNRGPLADIAGRPLEDPRVVVRETDVALLIRGAKAAYDAILLDVDNGPAALTAKGNDRIYSTTGLRAAYNALRPGGILGVWVSGPAPSFTPRLRQAGFTVDEVPVRGQTASKGPRYRIWLAQRG
ncbi:MAG TPA: spermidine synthase [Thermoanaerobaculia bacterium]